MLRAVDTIVRTDTGRQRRGNEDSAYAQSPVFVLADGMGGAAAGEVASHIAVESFERGLPAGGTPEERLAVVVQRANREIYDRSQADHRLDGMGTTLTAVYLDADHISLAHVGDSRAYRLRDGELQRLTVDHSLVEELVKDGKLTEDEAFEHPQRSIITRALGQEPTVEVDTFSYPVRAGDVVLLCSDGLTDMLPERQVAQVMADASGDLGELAAALIDAANQAGGRDNITVVLFRVEDGGSERDALHDTMAMSAADAAAAGLGSNAAGRGPAQRTPQRADPQTDPTLTQVGRSPYVEPRPDIIREGVRAGAVRLAAHLPSRSTLPLARSQGPPSEPPRPERHFGWLGKTVAALITAAILAFLILGGGYLASRQLYFLGTDNQGTVVVYRGFPYEFLGVNLYETYYVSGVPAALIPATRRSVLLNHQLHGESQAFKLINALELDQISG